MYIKRFLEWINLKEKLHSKIISAPYVNEGEMWWASMGENIGFEINGKSKSFTRPVVIYKKLTHNFYFVIPTTTQNRTGSWYVNFVQQGVKEAACLHQVRTIDYKRLFSKIGEVDEEDFKRIKIDFLRLYS